VLGTTRFSLADELGRSLRLRFHGLQADAVPLPHPSGLSAWPKVEPGKTLLARALDLLAAHPTWRATFAERAVTV